MFWRMDLLAYGESMGAKDSMCYEIRALYESAQSRTTDNLECSLNHAKVDIIFLR